MDIRASSAVFAVQAKVCLDSYKSIRLFIYASNTFGELQTDLSWLFICRWRSKWNSILCIHSSWSLNLKLWVYASDEWKCQNRNWITWWKCWRRSDVTGVTLLNLWFKWWEKCNLSKKKTAIFSAFVYKIDSHKKKWCEKKLYA